MTIPVTTRTGLGSPLPTATMDTNLTNLARDADESTQGNLRVATQVETDAGTSDTLAISPLKLASALADTISDVEEVVTTSGTPTEYTITYSGGTVIKTGRSSINTGDDSLQTVNFVVNFPTNLFYVTGTWRSTVATGIATAMTINPIDNTSFGVGSQGGTGGSRDFDWIAIGD